LAQSFAGMIRADASWPHSSWPDTTIRS